MLNFPQSIHSKEMYQKTTAIQTNHPEGIKKFFLRDLIKESSLKNENHIKPQSSINNEINNYNNEISKNFQSKDKGCQQNKRNLAFDVIYTWETDTTSGLRFINVVNKKDKKKLGFQCIYCRDKQLFKKKSSVLYHLVTFNHSLKTSVVDDLKGCRFESDQRLEFISNLDKEKPVTKNEEPLEKKKNDDEDCELIHKELEFISTLYLLTNEELKELFFFYFQENPILCNDTSQKESTIEQFIQKINLESEKYCSILKKTYDTSTASQQNKYISLDAYLKEFKKETEKNYVLLNNCQEKESIETNGKDQNWGKEEKVGNIEIENVPNRKEKQTNPIIKIVEGNVDQVQNECIQESLDIESRNEETKIMNHDMSERKEEECNEDIVNIETHQVIIEKNKECRDQEIQIKINDHQTNIVDNPIQHSEIVTYNIVTNNINKEIEKRRKYKKRETKIKEVVKSTNDTFCNSILVNQRYKESNEINIQNDNESKPLEINQEVLSRQNSDGVKARILSILLNMNKPTKKRKNNKANNLIENTASNKKRNKPDISQLELSILNELIEKIQIEPQSENDKERKQNEKVHTELAKKNNESEQTVNEQIIDLEKIHSIISTDHSNDGDKKENEINDNKDNTLIEIKEKKKKNMETNDGNQNSEVHTQDKRMKQSKLATNKMSDLKNKRNLKKNNIIHKTNASNQKTLEKGNKITTKIKTRKIIRNNPKKNIVKLKKKTSKRSKIHHGKSNHQNSITEEKTKTKLANLKTTNFSMKETKYVILSPIRTRRQLYTTVQNSVQNIKTNLNDKRKIGNNNCKKQKSKYVPHIKKTINKQNKENILIKKSFEKSISIANKNKSITSTLSKENIIDFEDVNHNSKLRCCRLSRYIKS